MKPHEERVVQEKKELDEKRERLRAFIQGETYQTLDVDECLRMKRQLIAMDEYSRILGTRIAAFPPE